MPTTQTQIQFPVRKSARRKTAKSCDNVISEEEPSRITRSRKVLTDTDVNKENVSEHRKSSKSKKLSTQSDIIAKHETTPKLAAGSSAVTPSKRRAKPDSTDSSSPTKIKAQASSENRLPFSPSKQQSSIISVTPSGTSSPSARKQLSMGKENYRSPLKSPKRLATKGLLTCKSPQRAVVLSPPKQTVSSLRKSLDLGSTTRPDNKQNTPSKRNEIASGYILSPRKRLDMSPTRTISPRKQSMMSPRKAPSPLRRLDLSPRKPQSPRKQQLIMSPVRQSPRKNQLPSSTNSDIFAQAKQALNTQQPDEVVCREAEISRISSFLDTHISDRKPGSLYISGAPGTGKTAVIKHLLDKKSSELAQKVFINSMTVKSPYTMYRNIVTDLLGSKAPTVRNAKAACAIIQKHLTATGKMVLIVLDEMDQLDSKHQEVLYTIFEWPSLPNSRLVLIGIANALDLTDRILPRLNVRSEYKPQLLHFAPYTKEQIVTVIESRLQQTPQTPGNSVLDKAAMMFCARKVSAVAGDMRKALDICRRSVELAQLSNRKQDLLRLKGGSLSGTPMCSVDTPTVGIAQVANVVNEVYGSTNTSTQNSTFPLQQKLIICTLLLILKTSKLKELTLGKLHDSYCRVCKKRDVSATDQSEFIGLCQLLETRALISLKKAKDARLMKISLKLDAKELEFALKDKHLISSVLDAGL